MWHVAVIFISIYVQSEVCLRTAVLADTIHSCVYTRHSCVYIDLQNDCLHM